MIFEETKLFKTLEPYQQRLSSRLPESVKAELVRKIEGNRFRNSKEFSEYIFATIVAYFEDEIESEVARDMGKKIKPRKVAKDEDFEIPLVAERVEKGKDGKPIYVMTI